MTVYITKYALTRGIFTTRVVECGEQLVRDCDSNFPVYYRSKEWHHTWEGALVRAQEMRNKKQTRLAKQMDRLAHLEWIKP